MCCSTLSLFCSKHVCPTSISSSVVYLIHLQLLYSCNTLHQYIILKFFIMTTDIVREFLVTYDVMTLDDKR